VFFKEARNQFVFGRKELVQKDSGEPAGLAPYEERFCSGDC